MSKQARIPDTVHEKAAKVMDRHDFATYGEAIRYMCREGGFDV
jgi:hypothetical protein